MDCEFKLRAHEGKSELITTYILGNPEIQEFCSVQTKIDSVTVAVGVQEDTAHFPGCFTSSECNSNEYCDSVERLGSQTKGSCKRRLSENRDCTEDRMCKSGFECRLPRFENTKKCLLKPSMSVNYELGSDI